MTPIFVITCDRLESLRKSVESYYGCIREPFEIVMVDFGSTYPLMTEFLARAETRGDVIYREQRITNASQLNRVSSCIQDYFKTHPQSNYVVTDPDVALDNTPRDVLDLYSYLLETFPQINVVGPMLRIDDIPDHYPLKGKLLNGEMGLHKGFHSQPTSTIQYKGWPVKYIFAPVDTTFGLYRVRAEWARLKSGVRVLPPYGARHLDWYIDPANPTPDQAYYVEHASRQIAHWGMNND